MSQSVINLECPGCAAALTMDMKFCPKCYRPIVISSFHSLNGFSPIDLKKQTVTYQKAMENHPESNELHMSAAFCYMKLKLYDKAIHYFEKALENNYDNADAYFYAAVALLRGRKAFLTPRTTINQIMEYIDAANMIEPKGIYYYFLAYIKYDYFKRKSLNHLPSYRECIGEAMRLGITDGDIRSLYDMIGVERPREL